MTHDDAAHLDDRLLHRLMFFTDAVFAIVLTLLVLELKAPEGPAEATAASLVHAAGHIGAFAFSFAIIAIFWLAHMSTMRRLARFDWMVAAANLAFLLPVCLLPYATGWLGAALTGAFAWALYSWVLVAISAANVILVITCYRGGGRLISGAVAPGEVAYRMLRAASPGLAFAIGLLVLAAGQTILAHYCCLLIPVFMIAARLLRRSPAPAAEAA